MNALLFVWRLVKSGGSLFTFKKGKGTYATIAIGLIFVALKTQFGIDLTEAVEFFTKLDPEVQKVGWWSALGIFARRALG